MADGWNMKPNDVRARYYGDDLDAEVWQDRVAVQGTPLVGVPWFWSVRFQRDYVIEDGNARTLISAKQQADRFAREVLASKP